MSTPPAQPVPSTHEDLVGDWVCTDGARWSFRANGTYSHRTRDWVYDDGVVFGYGPAQIDLGPDSFLDDVVSETNLRMEITRDGLCAVLGHRTCARVDPRALSPELQGIWALGTLALEVRGDGHARYRDTSQEGGYGWKEGALLVGEDGEIGIRRCYDELDLALPLAWDGLEVVAEGGPLARSDIQFDDVRLEAERLRRKAATERGGGSRRSRDHDVDHDFDFD